MNNENHTIKIDALAAYKQIGVDLKIHPFADQCVIALRDHLTKCVTPQLLVAALAEAALPKKRRRSSNATPNKAQTGEQSDEKAPSQQQYSSPKKTPTGGQANES